MKTLKLSQIKPDPTQPRQEFNPYDLELLKKSIASQGLLTPLVVEERGDHYLLVDGERRYRALSQMKIKEVNVEVMPKMTDLERLIRRFHIQEQHRNWSYFDKARAIKHMIDAGELKEQGVAEVLGLSSKSIGDMLALLSLSNRTQQLAVQKRISYPFLMRINRALRATKQKDLRPKLEEALIDRVTSGQVKKVFEIDDFSRSIQKGGKRILLKIINNKSYDCDSALADSKADDLKLADSIRYGIGWINTRFDEAINKKAYKWTDESTLAQLKRVHRKIGEFINKAE